MCLWSATVTGSGRSLAQSGTSSFSNQKTSPGVSSRASGSYARKQRPFLRSCPESANTPLDEDVTWAHPEPRLGTHPWRVDMAGHMVNWFGLREK